MQKIVFREMVDEQPDADTGNVVLELQEQAHSVFNRNEPSFLLKHSAVLSSRSLVWTAGEIVQPTLQEFDPFENDDGKME